VKDLQISIAHYVERFGFQLDFQGPTDDPYYGRVSRDGIGIMLKAIRPDVLPQPNHSRHEWARWDAYIYTNDPDPLFDELRQRGASFVRELSFIDDGLWGFEVTDADGYVIAFFRVPEGTATHRTHRQSESVPRVFHVDPETNAGAMLVINTAPAEQTSNPTNTVQGKSRVGVNFGGVLDRLTTDIVPRYCH
jgi:hypothetical protein